MWFIDQMVKINLYMIEYSNNSMMWFIDKHFMKTYLFI